MSSSRQHLHGVLYGLAAYLWWGLCPLYFKAVSGVPAAEVLAHRIVWSLLLLVVLLARRGDLKAIPNAARNPRLLLPLCATTLLVASNWFIFIWAVARERVIEASLGSFINPLVNVALGMLILREQLRRLQWMSLALATAGVVYLSIMMGGVPLISLALAFSFGLYGLARKVAPIGGVAGLAVETAILAPAALGALWWWHGQGALVFGHQDRGTDLLLAASGLVTALPLVWFANAARRLRYTTVGFLQYSAPTLQFLLAVAVFGEPFSRARLWSFMLIWCALGLFSFDLWRHGIRQRRAARRARQQSGPAAEPDAELRPGS
jgi:chloramphenicol-sensitive protein RarD